MVYVLRVAADAWNTAQRFTLWLLQVQRTQFLLAEAPLAKAFLKVVQLTLGCSHVSSCNCTHTTSSVSTSYNYSVSMFPWKQPIKNIHGYIMLCNKRPVNGPHPQLHR